MTLPAITAARSLWSMSSSSAAQCWSNWPPCSKKTARRRNAASRQLAGANLFGSALVAGQRAARAEAGRTHARLARAVVTALELAGPRLLQLQRLIILVHRTAAQGSTGATGRPE